MSFEISSAGREAAAHCQNAANCSVNRQWGTPKTPAPSGPLTLYVGPSRDAGRLRARQDRHRAAAPALSNGDGLSKQTHSAVLARALRGLGAGRAFAASGGPLCWRAADHPRQSANVLYPSGQSTTTMPSRVTSCRPTRSASPTSLTCPSDLSDSLGDLPPLSRSSSLSLDPRQGHFARVPAPPGPANLPRPKPPPADLNFLLPGPRLPT